MNSQLTKSTNQTKPNAKIRVTNITKPHKQKSTCHKIVT